MEDITKKKRAAAVAAVTAYIKTQEEAMSLSADDSAPVPSTPWGVSHRADMMQLRTLMQMKAFHGVR